MNELTPQNNIPQNNITHQVGYQPIDYFAEQNRVRAEKRAKRKKLIRIMIIVGGVLLLLLAGLTVLLLINIPSQNDGTVLSADSIEEVERLRELAETNFAPTAYENSQGEAVLEGDIESAAAIFTSALKDVRNRNYTNQIRLSAMSFYYYNGYYQEVVSYAENVDVNKLTDDQKVMFYNLAALGYEGIGNVIKSNEYMNEAIRLNILGE